MRYSALALAAAMAAPALAVGVADIPKCATTCALTSTSSPKDTGCTVTNLKCVCTSKLYAQQIRACLESPPAGTEKCSAADMQKTLTVSGQLCAQAGFPIDDAEPAGGASKASSASKSSTASKSSASSVSTSSVSGSATTAAAATTGTADVAAAPAVVSTATDASTSTSINASAALRSATESSADAAETSADVESSTGGAQANAKIGMGFLAIAGLAAAAM